MDASEFAQRLQNQPFSVLNDLVYQYILEAIVDVKYIPGAKINTKRISEELGISRTPVRTALDRLAEEKLVEQVGGTGFKVCQVDWRDCLALYDIRETIEGNAAYIAANTITERQLELLKQTILIHRKANEAGNRLEAFDADHRFHEIIVQATNNTYLIDMHNSLKIWVRRYQRALLATEKHDARDDTRIIDKHTVIFRALKNRYSLVAKNEMIEHLHYIYRVLFDGGLVTHTPGEQEL